jgi:hypothetical protein
LYIEFRGANAPAGHEQLRVLQTSLAHLPASAPKALLRSDTAGFQDELLLYRGEGKDHHIRPKGTYKLFSVSRESHIVLYPAQARTPNSLGAQCQ